MKKSYVYPELDLLKIKAADIISSSGTFDPDDTGENDVGYGSNW